MPLDNSWINHMLVKRYKDGLNRTHIFVNVVTPSVKILSFLKKGLELNISLYLLWLGALFTIRKMFYVSKFSFSVFCFNIYFKKLAFHSSKKCQFESTKLIIGSVLAT